MRIAALFLSATFLGVLAVGCEEETDEGQGPTATEEIAATEAPTETEALEPAATVEPTATEAAEPTQPPLTNRQDCNAISGTAYLSEEERQWYQANCVVQQPPAGQQPAEQQPPAQQPPPQQTCHPSYAGACLLPTASDYDCAGGSGNGPYYTGRVTVVGPDVYDLDRDGDTVGCE